MGRYTGWVIGAWLLSMVFAAPASAQVHADVGVFTPNIGARVAIGSPRVYVADPYYVVNRYYEPVYVPYDRHGQGRRATKQRKEHYKDVREARREYEKDRREAEREYWKDVREAQRDYEKDRREAMRDRRW